MLCIVYLAKYFHCNTSTQTFVCFCTLSTHDNFYCGIFSPMVEPDGMYTQHAVHLLSMPSSPSGEVAVDPMVEGGSFKDEL